MPRETRWGAGMPVPLSVMVKEQRGRLRVMEMAVEEASREFWRSSERTLGRVVMVRVERRRDITVCGRGRMGAWVDLIVMVG